MCKRERDIEDCWTVPEQIISTDIEGCFDLKIIPKFNVTASMVEWIEKVELVFHLLGVKQIDHLILLRLTICCVPSSKEEKSDIAWIMEALFTAFTTNSFIAYEKLEAHVISTCWFFKSWQLFSEEYQTVPWHMSLCMDFLTQWRCFCSLPTGWSLFLSKSCWLELGHLWNMKLH